MAEPLLALQVKPIQTPTYGDIMQERDAYRTQQNALAQQQLKMQQNAMRATIYRNNVDRSGNINQQGILRDMAQAGLGAEIPGQMEAYGKGVEATAKGSSEQFKHAQEILTVSRNELGNARTPEEAMVAGMRIAQQYPEAANGIRQSLGEVQGMSPEQFGAWKMDALRKNLTAAQQLQQHYVQQNLGGSTREIAMPKYGAGAATVVPGSEAQVTMTPQQQYAAEHPTLQHVEGADGIYSFNTKTGGADRVMVGGGGIPAARGGGAPTAGQYGAAIENAAMQLAPGVRVSGRGRTPERNAEVGGVANSYHLSDNARDLQPARGQSLDQLAASLAPLKQQGFDVIIERGKNHVHVEPGPGMGRAGAAPAAGGGQLRGPVKGAKAANPAAEAKAVQRKTALTNELQMALDLVMDPSNSSAFQSSKKTWWDNQAQSVLHGKFNPKTAEFGVHTALPGGVAHKSVWDRVTKHLIGAMYQTIEPGQAGMNRAVASQKMHVQMMGGGDNPSKETLIEAIKSTAADYGIKLNERGGGGGGDGQAPAKPAAVKRTAGGASVSDW